MRGFNTLRFETTADGQPIAGLGGGEGEFANEPPTPAAEPETQYAQIPAEQWEQVNALVQQQQEMLQQLAPVAEYMQAVPTPGQFQQQQPPEIDLFGDNPTDQIRQLIREETAPYHEVMQARRLEELESSARDMIHDVQSAKGEILAPRYDEGQDGLKPDDLILEIAKSYSPAMVSRYGEGVRADEAAIEAAYEDVKMLFDGIAAAHDARAQNQVNALRQAPREPGSSGIAAQPAVTTVPGGFEAFKARHGLG